MDRDFVWKADYGNREGVICATKQLLSKQNAKSLKSICYFVNNNPYNFEFYILVSYDSPIEEEIAYMIYLFGKVGVKYRQDITMDSLFAEMGNRRFDSAAFYDSFSVDVFVQNHFFFPERKVLEAKGYIMTPFSREKEVFISHSSENKTEIKSLIPYLNGMNYPVWFDEYNIEAGDSLYDKIENGIIEALVIVFWVTEASLLSDWCTREITLARENNCNIIFLVEESVDSHKLPKEVCDYRYISIKENEEMESIAKKIVDGIKKYI